MLVNKAVFHMVVYALKFDVSRHSTISHAELSFFAVSQSLLMSQK